MSGEKPAWVAVQAITMVFAVFLTYIPALKAGFVWNDHDLTANLVFKENGLFRVWFTTESVNYWPMVWTSYWIEHQFWGFHPLGYHVVNIALHAGASLLIWRILRRLNVPGSWYAALLFALHPVNVESVAWVTQRKNVLCLVFFAASVWSFLRHDDRHGQGVGWATVVWFLLAMLSKGAAAPLPVVLLLCIWWRRSEALPDDVSQPGNPKAVGMLSRDVFRVLPCFAVSLIMSSLEIWFQSVRAIGNVVVRNDSFWDRMAGAGWVVWFYLSKVVWPVDLTFVYPRWEIDATRWPAHLPNLALLLLLMSAWWFRKTWGRPVLFALTYFVVMLTPVLGFFDIYFMLYSLVADHYQYLAMIGPIALLAAAGTKAFCRSGPFPRWMLRGIAMGLPLFMGYLSWQQSHIYHDQILLWRDTLRKNPDAWLAHHNLGKLLAERQEFAEAAHHFQEVLRIRPDDAWAHHELGHVRQAQGNFAEAEHHYRLAIHHDPSLAESHYNLGVIAQQRGTTGQAIQHYQAALKILPDYAAAHNNLGTAFEIEGRDLDARRHYQEALRIEPANVQALANLERLRFKESIHDHAKTPMR